VTIALALAVANACRHVLCRDADDAFSLDRAEGEGADVWRLAVHIADLSPWTTDR
jgi:hypothetical protein